MLLAELFVIGRELFKKSRLLLLAEERADDIDRAGGVEHVDNPGRVVLGDFDSGVRAACGGAADNQRDIKALALHLLGDVNHLVERRRDEAGEADDVAIFLAGRGENFLAGDHDAKVDNLVVVTSENDAHDVLADVVHVALDRGHEDPSLRLGIGICGALGLHVWGQPRDGFFHHTRALHDLGQEHFSRAEEITDDLHAVHQRAFNHEESALVFGERLLRVGVHKIHDALDERVLEAFLDGALAPGEIGGRGGAAAGFRFDRVREIDEPLGGIVAAVEEHVFNEIAKVGRDFLVNSEHAGIDDPHVESRLDRVIEKRRVHRLAHGVIAAE